MPEIILENPFPFFITLGFVISLEESRYPT